ncbi:MAG: cadherin repeat domain-containing protein [Candidatus Omnitrophica bacterium]|nr:cadherin repeat domain-containing protein [Candidatus Omnitrophota bacterium]
MKTADYPRSLQKTRGHRTLALGSCVLLSSLVTGHWPLVTEGEAAVSKGRTHHLEAFSNAQGGGRASSSQLRQQSVIGEAIAGSRLSGSRVRAFLGFLGAALAGRLNQPVNWLDLAVLYAKTDPSGAAIPPKTWERHNEPVFIWEPPSAGPDVAGYSYAMDRAPDPVVNTTQTSLSVRASGQGPLTDGKHTFSVQAINTAGRAGRPISFEIWVDTTPPQIVRYAPAPGALLKTPAPAISVNVSDAASGVKKSTVSLFSGSTPLLFDFDEATGLLTTRGTLWNEGVNRQELRVADAVGNSQPPLIWSVTVDTQPPIGTMTINAGATMTTSASVTLSLRASDAVSGVERMLLGNEEAGGYVEEPYAAERAQWKLNPIRGRQAVYVKFVDRAGNVSSPVSDEIELSLRSPETKITSGPAGVTPNRTAAVTFACPEGECLFSFAFDNEPWSAWSPATSAAKADLAFGNHFFRVKAAKEVNGLPGIQPDEEDPSPAERTWIVGVEPPTVAAPKGPAIKLWRLE